MKKHLNIKGQRYKVIITQLEQGTMGLCDKRNKKIYIDSSLNDKNKTLTFLHEYIHGLCCETGLDQSIDATAEEMIAESWSVDIYNNLFFSKKKLTKKKKR